MAKSIPIDVIRDMRNKIRDMKACVKTLRRQENEARIKAEIIDMQAGDLEDMVDKWEKIFPAEEAP